MASEAPYLHCRLCGSRYRSDKAADHEKQCSYKTSRPQDNSPSSRNEKESVPLSSRESGVNQLRDREEYYMKATKSSDSSVNLPDPKSNEESKDSPLKNRTVTKRYQTKTTKTYNSSKPRNSSRNAKEDSANDSTKDHGINEVRVKEENYTQSERSPKSSANQPKDPKSNEKSNDSPINPNRKEASGSRERQDEPTESQGRKESIAWEIPSDNVSSAVGQSKGKSPPKLSSSGKKSHSNENTPVKVNPGVKGGKERVSPQKSNEKQKDEMARTPYPSEEDIRVPSSNTEEINEVAEFIENLPELTEQNLTAYEKHQRSLVPCTHCERKFRPDRLPIHEGSCPKRPQARKYSVFKDNDEKSPK